MMLLILMLSKKWFHGNDENYCISLLHCLFSISLFEMRLKTIVGGRATMDCYHRTIKSKQKIALFQADAASESIYNYTLPEEFSFYPDFQNVSSRFHSAKLDGFTDVYITSAHRFSILKAERKYRPFESILILKRTRNWWLFVITFYSTTVCLFLFSINEKCTPVIVQFKYLEPFPIEAVFVVKIMK